MKLTKIVIMLCLYANVAFSAYPYAYVDSKGYEAQILKKPERIVIAGGMWPLPSVIMLLENGAKNIIYMPKASKNALQNGFMLELFPEIKDIKAGENENIEELLLLKPDVFICHSANAKLCSAMKQTRIPTIEMSVSAWDYDSFETIKGWLDIIAPVIDRQDVAKRFIESAQKHKKDMKQRLDSQSQKPRAIIIHHFENPRSFTAGGIFADSILNASGAENVISSKTIAKLSLEDLYALNPDIVYINNFNTLLPEDILTNTLWQPLKAVQNKRVYKFPLGSYRPFAPSLDLPILLEWLTLCNADSLNTESKTALFAFTALFYKNIFDIRLNQNQIERIFSPNRAAGALH